MRTVSFQGTQLSVRERTRIEQQKRLRGSFMNPILSAQVDEAFAKHDQMAADGIKPKPMWTVDRAEKSAPWLGDVFGFDTL